MKKWVARFASLYVFDVVVLFVIGLVVPPVSVGWAALWAAVILTLATLLLKPALTKAFSGAAAKSAGQRTKAGEKVVQYALVYVVSLIIWALTVWLTGVRVDGFFWGYVVPPMFLLIAWIIYDLVDDKIEARASGVYDRDESSVRGRGGPATASAPQAPAAQTPEVRAAYDELRDGLTAQQRKMLDEL